MGAPIRESDDSEPLKGELQKTDPSRDDPSSRNDPLRDVSRRAGTAPPDKTYESIEPPRRSRTPRGVFEGDVAAVELRSRLARARNETLLPASRRSSSRRFAATLRYAGFLLMAAMAAGVAGYLAGGFGLPSTDLSPGRPHRVASDGTDVVTPPVTPAASFKPANRESQTPAAQTAADVAPADARAQTAAPSVVPPPVPLQNPPRQDPADVAAKLKIGADLIASGDIAAARTVFERVAEAGEAAGAFALAETYDPAVLRALRLHGGIKADPALAQRWYEKAKDMGSAAAAERIARLTQNPR
jgi:hypothetical protein